MKITRSKLQQMIREELAMARGLEQPVGTPKPGELADDADQACREAGGEWIGGECVKRQSTDQTARQTSQDVYNSDPDYYSYYDKLR
jgi:hypothetical protein